MATCDYIAYCLSLHENDYKIGNFSIWRFLSKKSLITTFHCKKLSDYELIKEMYFFVSLKAEYLSIQNQFLINWLYIIEDSTI